jgi:hypothetical protein
MAALTKASSSAKPEAAESQPNETAKTSASANANWGTEVAAMDKLLADLVGSGPASASESTVSDSATAGATGTSGTSVPKATAGSSSKATASLDEATRARLVEVRTHLTAYAAAKAGSTGVTASTDKSAAAPAAAQQSTATPSAGAQGEAAQNPSQPSAQEPAAGSEATPGSAVQAQPTGQVDEEGARRALTAARDSLSQMTQLPAAAQLTGEARSQVAQLISNFNELITTQVQWRASYAKVAANLNALLGPDNTDAEAAGGAATMAGSAGTAAAPGSSTAGAAGTSGSSTPAQPGTAGASATGAPSGAVGTTGATAIQIDPAIRAKLIELRQNLTAFEKASGGAEK